MPRVIVARESIAIGIATHAPFSPNRYSTEMLRALASLFFYARFLREFSALGFRRRQPHWKPLAGNYRGQRWLVTGATGGIGRAIALAANRGGATVLAAARDQRKLAKLREDATCPEQLLPIAVDLSSMTAVAQMRNAAQIAERPVDVLINNVGVLLNDFGQTEEGLETSFATNILGHFVLTEGLRDAGLLQSDSVVINMSSGGIYGTPLRREAMAASTAQGYDGMAAYATHKRAQVALTGLWNQRWNGSPRVYVMHPGWVDTAGVRSSLPWFRATLKHFLRNAEQGADTALWLAEARPEIDGGIYLDRSLQPEHCFAFTRRGECSAEDLHQYLEAQAARCLS